MNSSSSNSNNRFSNFDETNPVLGFNSPPLAGAPASSGSNHSRQRIMKVRKQTSSHNYKPNDNDLGLGFNQFVSSSESVFGNLSSGSSGNVVKEKFLFGNVIVDDMSKLKIDSGKEDNNVVFKLNSVDESVVNELPKEISKLKIEDESNVGNVKNYNAAFVNSNVAVELQNEMKKMNINDPVDISSGNDNVSSSVVGSGSFTSRSEKMPEFAFSSKLDDIGAPVIEFKTPDMKSNMFSGLNKFEAKKVYVKDIRSKKKKGRMKTPIVGQSRVTQDFMFNGRSSIESFDTFKAYSPMDISPNDEKLAGNYSRETSATSEDGSQINDEDNEVFEPHINEVSETESFKSAYENMEFSSDTYVTALDSDESSTATFGKLFNFASKSENISKGNFTFAGASSSQSQLPSETRHHKKKHPQKLIHDSYIPTAEFFPISGNSSILSTSSSKKNENLKPVIEQDFRHVAVSTSSSSKIAEEACEKWRLRGNQAYSNGDLAKAEDCYTQGLNSVSRNEKSRSCLRALMLCYSNRAATRISLGRMKDALGDCLMAINIDPNFIKVQVRAAHCYLAMGEIENAKKQYMKCLQFGTFKTVEQKVIAEASEGLEKAEKVLDCIKQCTDLFPRQTSEDLECAFRVINEALQISTCSQKLIQMKAEALFMMRKYEQVIQVCKQTLSSDEADTLTSSSSRLWKPHLIVKSYFYLGRLDDALEFIKKQEISDQRVGNTSQESAIPLADTIRELLSHKTAGNEAYKSGKHAEAVEHYAAALSCNAESQLFASVCFCNRAAAYRGLGQITDAIADCSLAIALDPNYLKAISRRSSLYELIRDYGQAAKDLQKLVSLLTTQMDEKGDLSGPSDKLSRINELKQTQLQLSNVEEESRKGIPLNMYIILGVESSASAADIKKAYRKAALRHHPDKAAQSLGRSDDGDDGLWKEIAENVHKDADRLFKMIGEAYAVLSNPSKRSRYDEDEEMRNETNKFSRSNSSRKAANVHNTIFERSGSEKASSYRYSRYY